MLCQKVKTLARFSHTSVLTQILSFFTLIRPSNGLVKAFRGINGFLPGNAGHPPFYSTVL